jgi:phosphonate transport system substrate-binding protein
MMTHSRRAALGLALAASFAASGAFAQDWRAKYPELVFAVVPAENASGVADRVAPFMNYLSKELGVKVSLRVANDYAAVIEGQRAGNIHIAQHGPASYARGYLTGVKATPFAIQVNGDGTRGYYSVFYVKANSPYKKIEDLKGKNLGLVDPNSTSGNNVPRFALDRMGIDPEKFFGKVVFAGSHENAVIALQQGTVDVAANWWNDEKDSNLQRMVNKGMVKAEDFRILFKSDQIVNSPYTYIDSLPEDLKKAIRDVFFAIEAKDKAAFDRLTDGKDKLWQPVTHEAYKPVVELIKFVDTLRKKGS